MSLFGTKKIGGESFRTLSEKEIQQKLYGHLRTGPRTVQEDLPSFQPAAPAPKASAPALKPAPAAPVRTPAPAKTEDSDLFKLNSLEEATSVTLPEPTEAPKPAPVRTPATERKTVTRPVFTPSKPAGPSVLQKLQGSLKPALISFGKAAGAKLMEGLGFLIAALWNLGGLFDFRKPHVRKGATIMGVIFLIYGIFASISTLNSKREVAMKSPRASVVKPAKGLRAEKKTPATPAVKPLQPLPAKTEVKKAEVKPAPVAPRIEEAPAVATVPPASEGNYVIQIATFALRTDALKLAEKLKEAGFGAFLKPLTRPGGKTYFCAFLGRFKSYDEAESKLAEFRKKEVSRPFQDAFVRSL